nr:hypothetical protein [Tanacetum cinerariifolium]
MSNTNNNMQTQTSNTLYNAIMEAGSKDRPPMLAPGNYVQWKSRIKRYINTKPNHELIHYFLTNPPYELGWKDKEVPTSEGSLITTTVRVHETYKNDSQEIRDQLNAEAEAVQIILIGIDNDIYSTVNACPNACEMWKAIESEDGNPARANVKQALGRSYALSWKPCQGDSLNLPDHSLVPAKSNSYLKIQIKMIQNQGDRVVTHYMYMAQHQQVSLDAADFGLIFDDEPLQKVSNDDHYNVFAIGSTHPEQSESVLDTYPIEQDAQNVIIDSLDMNYDREEIDQNVDDNDDNDLAKEREIEYFKNKNKSLESSNNFFKEANNKLSETNNLLYADYKKSEAELDRRNNKEYASQMELECTKVRGDLLSYKMDYQKSCTKYTETINALNQTILEMKDKLSAHQETISILSKQKEAQIKLYKTQEDKELDKFIELEKKSSLNAKTLNVNSISAMCDNCVLIDKHDMCVLNSVAKPIKRTVTSKSNQKPRNITKKLYERVSKTCSWWYSKFTPSGYKWKPKSGKENVNLNVSMPLGNASKSSNVMDTMTFRRSTVSNTPLSSNSFAARRDCPIHHRTVIMSNELDLLFSPMFDELLNGSSKVMSKSSTEELHQFDRLDVWELVDRTLCTNVINLKWL